MNKLKVNTSDQVNQLHSEIVGHLQKSLTKAIEIGSLLSEQKQALPHGSFTGWIDDNLTFSPRTARNYLKLHRNREKLTAADSINDAYKLLNGKTEDKTERVSDSKTLDELKDLLTLLELRMFFEPIPHIKDMMSKCGIGSIIPEVGEEKTFISEVPDSARVAHSGETLNIETTSKGVYYRCMYFGTDDGFTNTHPYSLTQDDAERRLIGQLARDFHFEWVIGASKKNINSLETQYYSVTDDDKYYLINNDSRIQIRAKIAETESKINLMQRGIQV